MIPCEIATLVSWSRVLEETGTKPGRHGRTLCSVHQGDNPQAFTYSDDSGKAHCFSCDFHGDKIDFLQAVFRVDFKTALARLAKIAGVHLNRYCKPGARELQQARAHRTALTQLVLRIKPGRSRNSMNLLHLSLRSFYQRLRQRV